jgi:acyl-CoA oxidase
MAGRRRADPERVLAFAPLIYVAWADGVLTERERAAVHRRLTRSMRLSEQGRADLAGWLDPAAPPDATELAALLAAIRARADGLPESARTSLAAAGAALAGNTAGPAEKRALRSLERVLGTHGREAVRSVLGSTPADAPTTGPAADFDVARLRAFLDEPHGAERRRLLERLATPAFARPLAPAAEPHREQVLAWCRMLADEGYGAAAFPAEFGGLDDVGLAIARFETLAFHDLSLLVKYGVQFGLFAGSIFLLGTRLHHERWLADAAALRLAGCFAMTETGHGSNVRAIRTTATYDHEARELVVHTPDDDARKDYIGNAALHGRMAIVFAQLDAGGRSHGVHAIMVRIREDDGTPCAGIGIEDCGPKAGLNGVDNGRLRFDRVRVPVDHLLDRFGGITADGLYRSGIPSPNRRFFTMLGTLVAGRISIGAAAVSAAKSGLAIAIPYADARRQFGPEAEAEVPLLDYLAVQRRLLPALAATYALHFASREVARRFAEADADGLRSLEGLAAALKASASEHAAATLQHAREVCGGYGYLAQSRIPELRADTDVFTTFEGANDVLWQLVAKGLLTGYRQQFGEIRLWAGVRFVAARARQTIRRLNPVAPRRSDDDHIDDPRFHRSALRRREQRLLSGLARRLKARIDEGLDPFDALNASQDHAIELARAHMERWTAERFQDAVRECPDPHLARCLARLAALHALHAIERNRAWFLEAGYFESAKARAVRRAVNRHCAALRPMAPALAAAFGIPAAVLATAPPGQPAPGWEGEI